MKRQLDVEQQVAIVTARLRGEYMIHRGWKWFPPYICMGCGIEVTARQWGFSRSCGPCDVSNSQTRRLLYNKCFAGPHEKLPTWGTDKHHADIPEEHFVDPKYRDKYPVMRREPRKLPGYPPLRRMR